MMLKIVLLIALSIQDASCFDDPSLTSDIPSSISIFPPLPTESALLPLLHSSVIPDSFRRRYPRVISASSFLRGDSTFFRMSRRQCRIEVLRVDGCANCTGSFDVGGTVVDTISISHRGDLVIGEFGQFLGDDGGSSFGNVCVSKENVQLLERSLICQL